MNNKARELAEGVSEYHNTDVEWKSLHIEDQGQREPFEVFKAKLKIQVKEYLDEVAARVEYENTLESEERKQDEDWPEELTLE